MNKAKEALDSYNSAIQRFPQDERSYGAKGQALRLKFKMSLIIRLQKNYEEALKQFDKAIQMNPHNSSFYSGKVSQVIRDMNRYNDSLKYFDQAIQFNPENSFYYGAKADALIFKYFYYQFQDTQIVQMRHQNLQIQLQIGILILLIIMNQKVNYDSKIIANILILIYSILNIKFQLKIDEALKFFDEAIKRNPDGSKYYAEKADTLNYIQKYLNHKSCQSKLRSFEVLSNCSQQRTFQSQLYFNKNGYFIIL